MNQRLTILVTLDGLSQAVLFEPLSFKIEIQKGSQINDALANNE